MYVRLQTRPIFYKLNPVAQKLQHRQLISLCSLTLYVPLASSTIKLVSSNLPTHDLIVHSDTDLSHLIRTRHENCTSSCKKKKKKKDEINV